jgi:hypothetical protein
LASTLLTLFSLINGDDIHNTVQLLTNAYPFPSIARFYILSFVMLFICSVLNVFIFIIEDGYHIAKVCFFPAFARHFSRLDFVNFWVGKYCKSAGGS